MATNYEFFEHTADAGIRAYGTGMKEAFSNAAQAMFSLIVDPENVQTGICRDVEISAGDREALLVEWLNELLYLFDAEQLLFHKFDIVFISNTALKARCYGEKAVKSRHELRMGIKSATYHMLKVEDRGPEAGCLVQVLLDI